MKCSVRNLDVLIDDAGVKPEPKKKTSKKAAKEAEENPAAKIVNAVFAPKVKPASNVVPSKEREQLPEHAVGPGASVLDHLKEKRDKEKEDEACKIIVPTKDDIILTTRVTATEARLTAIEFRMNNPK